MQSQPGFCYWTDKVTEALAGKSMEERSERSDLIPPAKCQNAHVGTAVF